MIRVLHVSGMEELLQTYKSHFRFSTVVFDFVLRRSGQPLRFPDELDGAVHYVTPFQQSPILWAWEIRKIVENGNYDFVHCHASWGNALIALFCWDQKPKVVLHSHSIAPQKNIAKALIRGLLRIVIISLSDFRLAPTEAAGREMFGPYFTILPNATDYQKFSFSDVGRTDWRKSLNIGEEEFLIAHVGHLTWAKNHSFLINSFAAHCVDSQTSKLLLVGSDLGERDRLISQVAELGITERVIFLDYSSDIAGILSAADCFVFPSRVEGFGIALVEAQISGLPCIVADHLPSEAVISDRVIRIGLSRGPDSWGRVITQISRQWISGSLLPRGADFALDQKYEASGLGPVVENFYLTESRSDRRVSRRIARLRYERKRVVQEL
jgi:glycosyltransferase involved in cell wall biosynthesis